MNLIHSEKTVWILPERTASRTVGQLLNFWEVQIFEGNEYKTCTPHKNMDGSFSQGLRHEWEIPVEYHYYDILLNVRNPFTRMKSYYHSLFLKNDCVPNESCNWTFSEFCDNFLTYNGGSLFHLRFEELYNKIKPPIKVIRYENLRDDLITIPFIEKKLNESAEFRDEWFRVVENNIFTRETLGSSYVYTHEEAEKVFTAFEKQFQLFGYDENSWKYL